MARSRKSRARRTNNFIPLTPDLVRAAYDYLCETPPFTTWNMPDSADIAFRIIKTRKHEAHFLAGKRPIIAVSEGLIGHTLRIMEATAHEMLHLHQWRTGQHRGGEHNAAFKIDAQRICVIHGFDPKAF